MPKIYRRAKRYGKRALGFAKGAHTGLSEAHKALVIAKQIRSLINVERKWKLGVVNAVPISTSGTWYLLSAIAQGNGETQRNGDKVKLSSMSLKGSIDLGTGLTSSFVRMIVVNDKVSNGVEPLDTALLLSNTIYGHYNPDNCPSRFNILSDKVYNLNSDKTNQVFFNIYKKMYHHLTFTGPDEDQTQCNTGHIYIYVLCSDNITSYPALSFNNKLTFVDN